MNSFDLERIATITPPWIHGARVGPAPPTGGEYLGLLALDPGRFEVTGGAKGIDGGRGHAVLSIAMPVLRQESTG